MAITLNGTSGPTFDSGQRITGDMSNSTLSNRLSFQTSTANSVTGLGIIPNGTSTTSRINLHNSSNPNNSSYAQYGITNVGCEINSAAVGTGTYLPIVLYTNNTEQMRIATDGTITSTLGGMQVRSGTAVASTSGTSIDFTGIPSWAKKITVMFDSVSTNGSSLYQIQIGNGTIQTTGYVSGCWASNTANNGSTTGFLFVGSGASTLVWSGSVTIYLINAATNLWGYTSGMGQSVNPAGNTTFSGGGGSKSLAGTLDRIRITTVNGTDAFDAGLVNILYE